MENPSNEQHQSDESYDDEAINLFNEIANDSDDSNSDELDELDHGVEDGDNESDEEAPDKPASKSSSADEDPWAAAPEHLRTQYQQLQQSHQQLEQNHRANSGRVSALTKKLSEVQAGLKRNETENGGDANSKHGLPTADDLKGKDFSEVEAEWPEIANLIRSEVQRATNTFEEKLKPVRELEQREAQKQEQEFIQSQFQRLERVHPDYLQIASSPQLTQWLATQPPSVREMAKSDLADDNIALLTLFKTQHPQKPAAQGQKGKGSLSDYAEIPRKGAGKAHGDSDDVDPIALFNQITSS